jgi:hypothetical protein
MREDTALEAAAPFAAEMTSFGPVDVTAALAEATRLLHAAWENEPDADRRVAYGAAAVMTAHAAIDALLQDWAHRERPDLESWQSGTTLMRAARFTGALDRSMPAHLRELSQVRRALGRTPTAADLERASAWLEGDGTERALATLEEMEDALQPRR